MGVVPLIAWRYSQKGEAVSEKRRKFDHDVHAGAVRIVKETGEQVDRADPA
jgi:hypothetical protein